MKSQLGQLALQSEQKATEETERESLLCSLRLLLSSLLDGKACFFCAFLCLCFGGSTFAAPGSWIRKGDMPDPRSTAAGCVVDGIFYVLGGHYPYQTAHKTVWAYDPRTDSWTPKADMPSGRHFHTVVAVDGIIYVVGGSGDGFPGEPVLPVAAYDPKTDAWTNGSNMLTGRAGLAACAVDGIIYAIGGLPARYTPSSTVEAYDPKANQWSRKASVPRTLSFPTASVANGLIYVFQGGNTFAYDSKSDHWTSRATFSPLSEGLMSATVDGTIYLFGGTDASWLESFDFTLAYDPAQDRFSARRKMPRTRITSACGVIDGKVFLAGGLDKEPLIYPDAVYYAILDVFDPQGGVTPKILSTTLENTNLLRLTWQAEAGMKYGVESCPAFPTNRWTRVALPTGTNVTAANGIVETTCPVIPANPRRFFRVFEAN
jgi:N-acetylneuraminic acid mutarotase